MGLESSSPAHLCLSTPPLLPSRAVRSIQAFSRESTARHARARAFSGSSSCLLVPVGKPRPPRFAAIRVADRVQEDGQLLLWHPRIGPRLPC